MKVRYSMPYEIVIERPATVFDDLNSLSLGDVNFRFIRVKFA